MTAVPLRDAAQALLDALPTIWQGSDEGRALRAALAAADTTPTFTREQIERAFAGAISSRHPGVLRAATDAMVELIGTPTDVHVTHLTPGQVTDAADLLDAAGRITPVHIPTPGDGTTPTQPDEVRGEDGLRMAGLPVDLVTYDSIEGDAYSVVPSVVIPHPTGTRVRVVATPATEAP